MRREEGMVADEENGTTGFISSKKPSRNREGKDEGGNTS